MNNRLKTLNCIWMIFLLPCSTGQKTTELAPEKPRHELEQVTHKVAPFRLPEEKIIRQDLPRFISTLNKKKPFSVQDWQLHDRLLNYYTQLKQGAERPNVVLIPARSRWTMNFESYCLDSRGAPPSENEKILWKKIQNNIPYLHEILELASKEKSLDQEDIQTLIWNLHNKTAWEQYPRPLQQILLSIDSQAPKKLPNHISETVKKEVLDIVRDQLPETDRVQDIVTLMQGKYYDYQQIRSAIESREPQILLS